MAVKRMVQVICLVLLAFVAVACSTATPTPTPDLGAKLLVERSQVQLQKPDELIVATLVDQHMSVDAGNEITTGDNGLGILTVADSLRVEILPSTMLQVKAVPEPDAPSTVKLHLVSGAVLQQLQRQVGQQLDVTIETDWATIRAESRPCQVYVEDNGVTRVVVLGGGAEVEAQDKKVVLRSGQATLVKPYQPPNAPDTAASWPIEDWVSRRRESATLESIQTVIATLTPTSTPTITSTPTQTPTPTPTSTPTIPPTLPADVRLTSDLWISKHTPRVGETITATFNVKNYGGQTFNPRKFGVMGRGPGNIVRDFYMIGDFSLDPGDKGYYEHNRELDIPGQYVFRPYYHKQDGSEWLDVPPDGWTNVITITVDGPPVVGAISIEPETIYQGADFRIRVTASDDFGVQSIWWGSDDSPDEGDEISCDGKTSCELDLTPKWKGKKGECTIYVQALDIVGQLSNKKSLAITVLSTGTFSLLIGGGPFNDTSVQAAMGLAINWAVLQEEIGKVVLVDFDSRETLAGPAESAYDLDLAKDLLARVGYYNFDVVLLYNPSDELATELAEKVAGYLKDVDISVEPRGVAQTDARTNFEAIIAADESCLLVE